MLRPGTRRDVYLCGAPGPTLTVRWKKPHIDVVAKRKDTLRMEFRDGTTPRCDVIPGGRLRQRVHISAGVDSKVRHLLAECACSAYSLVTTAIVC